MKAFAELLDRLAFAPQRSAKLRLLAGYFRATPDPDRGLALAALTGALDLAAAKPALVRALVAERVDPVLFAWSYDFVGDLAETVSLVWPQRPTNRAAPTLGEVVAALRAAGRTEVPALLAGFLDTLDATGRWALLKLVTGGLRVGVSARLAKTALAEGFGKDVAAVEELWHVLAPPYEPLFAWLEDRGPPPAIGDSLAFRPLMLAHPLEDGEAGRIEPAAFRAEWKWDGIRVQLVARGGEARLYSRSGDDIGPAFPELVAGIGFEAVLDGELMVMRGGMPAPFNDLQQRLNRKVVTAAMRRDFPAGIRLYDLLFEGGQDLRGLPFDVRRARLEAWFAAHRPAAMDLSPLVAFDSAEALAALRAGARDAAIEGLMLKRADSPYLAGRPKGHWFKWKRDPLTADTVLMYAQRGHGKRSSFYSDFTFGAWDGERLVPVGKAYFGFTDEELAALDRWVRHHTVKKFGPVREVEPGLVLEVAFDSIHPSPRHRSGLAMRFPRIHRIRWDKPAAEADPLTRLKAMVATGLPPAPT
ncbi:MAG: cisplatin damage response ATP-dependent DNA ligase [Thalassobaculales bacterium]